jgi:hypothetical protein
MPPDPAAFAGALNGQGPTWGTVCGSHPQRRRVSSNTRGAQRQPPVNTHGLGPVRAGEALDRTQLGHHGLDLAAVAVGEGVVSQHPLDGDVVGGEEAAGPAQESCAGGATLVGQDLGIGQPGVVIDGGMDLVIARAVVPIPAAMLARVAAMDAVAAAVTQPPELLDVHVEQLAGWARS